MKFFFDESGSFALPEDLNKHACAVVVGVSVSDVIEEQLADSFYGFVKGLSPDEMKDGEPKGHRLSLKSRSRFCDLLAQFEGVQITPTTLDLTSLLGTEEAKLPNGFARLVQTYLDGPLSDFMRSHLTWVAETFGKLSPQQAWRMYLWANSFREALHHAVLFQSAGRHASSWDNVQFEVDIVQESELPIFREILLGWLEGWSLKNPLELIEEIHTSDHPFVRNFESPTGVYLEKLLKPNLYFSASKNSWGLQIADICANIVYRALRDLENQAGELFFFASLMRSSPYGSIRGPGLVTPFPEPSVSITTKYQRMFKILERRVPVSL